MPVQEKVKSTLTVDENDILTFSKKIQKNLSEDKAFAESLENYLANTEKTTKPLKVGTTPYSLVVSGANPDLNVVINPRTIAKCMAEADEQYHGHGLSADIIKQLPEQLRNPAMIIKGNKDDSLVAITELKDKENREIMIAINLNEVSGRQEVNRISSVYGRNNMTNFLKAQMEQGNLIAVNKEKANEMLQSAGLQLPLEETFISFDNSIAYSDENVNTQDNNLKGNIKRLLPFLNIKYRHHLRQIDNFNEKKAACMDKINYRQEKINKLIPKAERLEETNKTLKALFDGTKISSLVNVHINRNEKKIKKIKEERIPKHQKKLDLQKNKLKQLDHKIAVKQCKADKLYNLSNLIKSFFILNGAKRHKQFMSSLEGLNDASRRSVQFKLDKCNVNIKKYDEKYLSTDSSVEKIDISQKLNDLRSRQAELSNKMKKLQKVQSTFPSYSPETIDKLIDKTEKQINEAIKSENLNVAELADDISVSSAEYLHDKEKSVDKEKVTHEEKHNKAQNNERKLYEKINPEYFELLKNKRPELDNRYTKKMKDDIADFTMQQLKEQGIMFSAVRLANNITDVTVHKDDHKALDTAMAKGFQQHKEKLIQDKKQAKTYNSEYYLSLPKENRLIAEFSSSDSKQYINLLEAENCKYSYRIKQTDRIAVTIDNRDDKAVMVYGKFLDSLEIPDLKNNLVHEISERGFSNEQVNYIQDLIEKSSLQDRALYAFTEKIKPEYTDEQISDIYNKVSEIYAQNELDRIQDKNGLYNQLGELVKDFDYEVDLKQVTQNYNFSSEQKSELLNALKSDISVESLQRLDESYSAEEIRNFANIYKTNDIDKINAFFREHDKKEIKYDKDLKQLTQKCQFSDEQKDELFNALKADISVEVLSKIDKSYSASEIRQFVDVYKSYDMDKIDNFFKNHKKSLEQQQSKKEVTFSRKQMKANAEKVSKEKSAPKPKAVEHAI